MPLACIVARHSRDQPVRGHLTRARFRCASDRLEPRLVGTQDVKVKMTGTNAPVIFTYQTYIQLLSRSLNGGPSVAAHITT